MTGFASTAIYLASSLTSAQAPGASPAMMIAAPAANVSITVNPFTSARNGGGKSLNEAIADEVRRDALARPAVDSGMIPIDADRDRDDEGLSGDVTAAHDARIGFIRQRMDELRLEGASAAPLLDGLRVRLRLAMAARRLAAARQAVGRLPTGCASVDPAGCGPAPTVMVADSETDAREVSHVRPHRRLGHSHDGHPARIFVASARSSPSEVAASGTDKPSHGSDRRRVADSGRGPLHRAPGRSGLEIARSAEAAPHRITAHQVVAHQTMAHRAARRAFAASTDGASDRARRSLAAARRVLQAGSQDGSHPGLTPVGLLHWEGSETWSLADCPRSAA